MALSWFWPMEINGERMEEEHEDEEEGILFPWHSPLLGLRLAVVVFLYPRYSSYQ